MIEANELKRGNLVYTFDTDYHYGPGNQFIFKVRDIGKCLHSLDSSAGYDEVEPIPLTSEILARAGFVKYKEYDDSWVIKTKTGEIILSDDYILQSTDTVTKLNYVHQLQNLYWCLCGEELEINLH